MPHACMSRMHNYFEGKFVYSSSPAGEPGGSGSPFIPVHKLHSTEAKATGPPVLLTLAVPQAVHTRTKFPPSSAVCCYRAARTKHHASSPHTSMPHHRLQQTKAANCKHEKTKKRTKFSAHWMDSPRARRPKSLSQPPPIII